MQRLFLIFFVVGSLWLAGCSSAPPAAPTMIPSTRADEVPMYGGMDRSKSPEMRAADEKFIADVTQHYGSREQASRAWVEQGFKFYQQDNLDLAMRRFNQAWLLNPANPEVYAGFGAVLFDQQKYCDAMQMMDRALALNPPSFQGIYTDAARTITLCAVNDQKLSPEARARMFARADDLYRKAVDVEPNKQYTYGSWASSYYFREQYADAWSMVAKQRAAGGKPTEKFLAQLRAKMPEPAPR